MWGSVSVPRFLGEMMFCLSVLMRHYEVFLITVQHSDSK